MSSMLIHLRVIRWYCRFECMDICLHISFKCYFHNLSLHQPSAGRIFNVSQRFYRFCWDPFHVKCFYLHKVLEMHIYVSFCKWGNGTGYWPAVLNLDTTPYWFYLKLGIFRVMFVVTILLLLDKYWVFCARIHIEYYHVMFLSCGCILYLMAWIQVCKPRYW